VQASHTSFAIFLLTMVVILTTNILRRDGDPYTTSRNHRSIDSNYGVCKCF
jgi:hypothetical protein